MRIGALATHRMVETSPLIRQSFPALAQAFGHIGNVRVGRTASVGGNLAHADYRLDPPPPLLVLGAEVNVFGPKGARTDRRIKRLFSGMYETALAPGEILVDVKIPFMPENSRAVYLRYSTLIGERLAVSRESPHLWPKAKRPLSRNCASRSAEWRQRRCDRRSGICHGSNSRRAQ